MEGQIDGRTHTHMQTYTCTDRHVHVHAQTDGKTYMCRRVWIRLARDPNDRCCFKGFILLL